MSILVLHSSWWGRESWLLCLIRLPGVSWSLSGSSSRCHGLSWVCDCGISWSYSLTIFCRGWPFFATHQKSRLYALWFQTRRFESFYLENLVLACVTYVVDNQWTRTIWTIIKEGPIKNIPAMFGRIPASSLGDVLWNNCWWHMTHDGHQQITVAQHDPMAQVS